MVSVGPHAHYSLPDLASRRFKNPRLFANSEETVHAAWKRGERNKHLDHARRCATYGAANINQRRVALVKACRHPIKKTPAGRFEDQRIDSRPGAPRLSMFSDRSSVVSSVTRFRPIVFGRISAESASVIKSSQSGVHPQLRALPTHGLLLEGPESVCHWRVQMFLNETALRGRAPHRESQLLSTVINSSPPYRPTSHMRRTDRAAAATCAAPGPPTHGRTCR